MKTRCVSFMLLLSLLTAGCSKRNYVATSEAMAPTIKPGDSLGVSETRPDRATIKRFDIVLFKQPHTEDILTAMRVIGMPGERIKLTETGVLIDKQPLDTTATKRHFSTENRKIYVYGVAADYQIPADSVFVLGDNVSEAVDSRIYGPILLSSIEAILAPKQK